MGQVHVRSAVLTEGSFWPMVASGQNHRSRLTANDPKQLHLDGKTGLGAPTNGGVKLFSVIDTLLVIL